ncbi:MAG: acyl-CoA dehydrogenase family protein [Deltaproteobacteria bacterium]|nr:acyl-CoA dehydrogenase family protein [Deltaproteobacteria bacterium]
MDFDLDETASMVQASARDFANKEIVPRAASIDREGKIPRSILKDLADLGMMTLALPEELGGADVGTVAYSAALTEIARGCASTGVTMSVTNMVAEVIARFGTDAQKKQYVPKLASGALVAGSFALSEPEAGSDPGAMRTTAKRDGDHWVIDGAKQWITSGDFAGVFVVWARTGGAGTKGISCFLVEQGTPGLSVGHHEDKMGLRGSSTTALHFEGVRVPETALLGELNGGFKIAMMALDGGRIGIASQAIGIAEAALGAAVDYAKERKTFGAPIADHQGIQWMIADSRTELDAARLLTYRAAYLKESKQSFSSQAAMAKLYATEAAGRICDRALQIHGGYGYVKEYDVERYYRDVRVTRIYEGTSEIQRVVIGRGVTG